MIKAILGFIGMAVLAMTVLVIGVDINQPNNPIWTGPLTGVHVIHNGQPIEELYVEVQCANCLGHGTILITGSTDGTGTFTWRPAGVWDGQILYKVTYSGQTYGIEGRVGQIVEDPI